MKDSIIEKITNTDPESKSLDLEAQNIEKLKQLFPDVFSEGKVDFEALKAALGDHVEDKEERYNFTWYGKNKARQLAQTPSTGTLRPCKEESVNWDTTENLFIEGDNLEVLKLLQKSYHRKIKVIYIDPPYNTGKDFIYPDNFHDNISNYKELTAQVDGRGFDVSNNAETSGRFHTNWLNMMLPRLKLARNLLTDDGVIFISIDDSEQVNLVNLCNEIYGEDNFLGTLPIVSNLKGRSDDKYFATAHNYLIAYKKADFVSKGLPLPEDYSKEYSEVEEDGRKYRVQGLRKRGDSSKREDRPNMYYPFYCNSKTGEVSVEPSEDCPHEVTPKLSDGTDGRWRWGRETASERVSELTCRTVGKDMRPDVFQKDYAEGKGGLKRIIPKTIWMGSEFANETGSLEVKKLFNAKVFDTPKPLGLIKQCLELSTNKNDIILDFFSGSCSSAHAVMQKNCEDGGNRKFIMVQLPEECAQNTVAAKSGFKTIADIGKERIRLTINKLTEGTPELKAGFKVFKLDETNIKQWDGSFDNLADMLDNSVDSIKTERGSEDVLYEILLKYGLDLTYPITEHILAGKTVYDVAFGSLIVCLDDGITRETVEAIGSLKQELGSETTRVVFKDAGFADDNVKTNAIQLLKQYGVDDVKSI
jgi:adenine-specific DNA-methyltransferase